MLNIKEKLNKITKIMFDEDGVLTDGKVLVMESGERVRNVYSKDGYELNLAINKGYKNAEISAGNKLAVKNALAQKGVVDVFIRQHDKLACYNDYLAMHHLKDEEIVFMGDDLPDYEIMNRVGLAVCPGDAVPEIKEICQYVSPKNGGEGCVR